jgi:hypothetical protein
MAPVSVLVGGMVSIVITGSGFVTVYVLDVRQDLAQSIVMNVCLMPLVVFQVSVNVKLDGKTVSAAAMFMLVHATVPVWIPVLAHMRLTAINAQNMLTGTL